MTNRSLISYSIYYKYDNQVNINMKQIIKLLTYLLIFNCAIGFSEVYKWIDDEGKVHYTNKPHKKATKVELSPFTVYGKKIKKEEKKGVLNQNQDNNKNTSEYSVIEIIEPKEDAVLRSDTGEIKVQIKLTPTLGEGHKRHLILDNTVPPEIIMPANSAILNGIERGRHQFVLEIKNTDGKVVAKSKPRHFTLRKALIGAKTD